jgi:hypothetical protein
MAMSIESDKVMFEIYRDPAYSGRYCVVYFTELNDRNRELEFNHALRGDHVFDGFLRNHGKEEAKRLITGILERLNRGDEVKPAEIREALRPYMP